MINSKIVVLLAIIYATPISAFDSLGPLIPPGFEPIRDDAEGGIWMVMDNMENKIRTSPLRFDDTLLEGYLHGVLCRLADAYCDDIRVYVVRTPHFNASMAPNGMMLVWTGLLLRTQNEAQLASVLGHELGHYLRRHSLQQFESIKKKAAFGIIAALAIDGAVAAGVASPAAVNANILGQLVLFASMFSYSRSHELEADKFGIQLLADAGYDTRETSSVWRQLIEEEEAADKKGKKRSLFFASHPSSKKRSNKLDTYADELEAEKSSTRLRDPVAFEAAVDSYLPELLQDQIDLGDFGRTEYLLGAMTKAERKPALVQYYQGELYRKRNEDGDTERAIQHYLKSVDTQPSQPEPKAYRALGLIELKRKNISSAQDYFRRYLDALPDAKDREMIEYYLEVKG